MTGSPLAYILPGNRPLTSLQTFALAPNSTKDKAYRLPLTFGCALKRSSPTFSRRTHVPPWVTQLDEWDSTVQRYHTALLARHAGASERPWASLHLLKQAMHAASRHLRKLKTPRYTWDRGMLYPFSAPLPASSTLETCLQPGKLPPSYQPRRTWRLTSP